MPLDDLEFEEDPSLIEVRLAAEGALEALDQLSLDRALAPRVPNPLRSVGDRNSALWERLSAWLKDDIEQLRERNDGDLDPMKTAQIRAQIRYAKKILALADKPLG